MDDRGFDALARSLAMQGSRRRAFRLIGATALGAALGALGLEEAAAACVPAGKKCRPDTRCCRGAKCKGGRCKCTKGVPCAGKCCPGGERCESGRCVADVPDPGCDTQAQTCQGKQCGAATNACDETFDCGTCPSGQTCRDNQCVCVPNCASRRCGDDGCGGSCGTCSEDLQCRAGECVCVPHSKEFTCRGKTCGSVTNNCGQSVSCGTCAGGKTCDNGNCRCPNGKVDCGGTCQECCTNRDCGIGTCIEGRCNAEPIVAEKPQERVGTGKYMSTTATFYRNGLLVAQTNTKNIDCCSGLRGRVLVVVRDGGGNAIWVSEVFACPTRCAAYDPTCAHEGVSTFDQQFPNHPTAGPVIGKWATALDIFQSDGESLVSVRDRWIQNIKDSRAIAEEIKEIAIEFL